MRLLFLTDGLAPFVVGGMQQHSTLLVKHMAHLVDDITLMHCGMINEAPPHSDEIMEALGHPRNVVAIGAPFLDSGRLPGHYLRASKSLSQSYLRLAGSLSDYDAIYAQGLTGYAFLNMHQRVVVNLHGLNMFQPGFSMRERVSKALMRPMFRRLIRNAWRNISLGGKLSELLLMQGAPHQSVVVIPNAIEGRWILSSEALKKRIFLRKDMKPRFVLIGRNDYVKGFHVLREAMKLLETPIELHLIGNWPQWDAGIHCVFYHGLIREKAEVMSKLDECDVLLMPSLSEGMPTVILEAMARGLAVIATDVGAVRDIVQSKWLIPPGNAEILAHSIRNASCCQQNNLKMFVWEIVANKTVNALNQDVSPFINVAN